MKKKILMRSCAMALVCIMMVSLMQILLISANAVETQTNLSVEVLDSNSPYQDDHMLDLISVPTRCFTYENNGGAAQNNELSKAFDRNWNTDWISGVENNVPANDPFYNTVTVHFKETVTLDSMIYAASSSREGYGFATKFNIYSAVGDGEMKLVGYGQQAATSSKVRIVFSEPVTCDHLQFEFREVNKSHKYVASAKEFIFLQKSEQADVDVLMNLFTDYAKYQIAKEYASLEAIAQLRAKFESNLNYADSIKPILDRAESILNGTLAFDARREFSTSPDAKNQIGRNGDIVSYARNTLKFNSFATNRQVTGISARANEVVSIYVEADEGDPLPRIRFSQFYGHWSKWLGGEIQLSRGLNRFTVPYLQNDSYSKEVVAGGTIYLVNPYTEEQQSGNVKVYFENGDLYPVFRKGDDEESYKAELAKYAEAVDAEPDKVVNITELVSNHTIMTVQASRANEIYQTASPQKNIENWETTVKDVLHFTGVEFEEGKEYYDKRNNYLNINFRVSQNWPNGFMFCHTEHIGLYAGGSEDTLINSLNGDGNSTITWGFVHEIGHALDIPERTVGETTNNMVANYNNTYKLGIIRNENYLSSALEALSSDRTLEKTLWGTNRYNYMVYWLIQSLYTDFWGKQDNLYRYTEGITGLTKTEKQVYIASLATGIDLSYYFERWGYCIDGDPFTYDGASEAFKTYMQQAEDEKKIKKETIKFWYFDSAQYKYMMDQADLEAGTGGMYQEDSETEILNVMKVSDGHSLILPNVENEAHLGYEILEGNDEKGYTVIGFTHANTFTDTTEYEEGYEPTYKIVAYDRLLKTSKESAPKRVEYQSGVCELNGVLYDTLSAAVAAASSGDTVYLLKNFIDSGVVIDKNLTVTIKEDVTEAITLSKGGDDTIFSVNAGIVLTVKGSATQKLILDGNNLKQKHALITVAGNGQLNIQANVTLQNNVNTSNGGAIYMPSASSRTTITGATIQNNTANSGGAIYNSGTMTVTGSNLLNNTATSGGAISNVSGGIIKVINSTVKDNVGTNGGAVYVDGHTTLSNSTIENNTATTGGAIYVSPGSNPNTRVLIVDSNTVIRNNQAKSASVLYMTNNANVSLNSAKIGNDGAAAEPAIYAAETQNTADVPAVYVNSGSFQMDGNAVEWQGAIHKNAGAVLIKGKLPGTTTDKLAFSLTNYDVTTPVFTTNFDLAEENLDALSIANEDYTLVLGEDKRSVYLKAKEIVYAVTFETNGGTINGETIANYTFGTTTALPTDVVKDGYTFAGWYDNANLTGTAVAEIAADVQGDKTYYAKWTANRYAVHLVTNGGTINSGAITAYTFGAATALPTDVVRDGYTFEGWYDNANLTGAAVTAIAADVQGDKTYYAKWEQNSAPVGTPEDIVVLGKTAYTLTLAMKKGHEYSIDGGVTWHRADVDSKYVFEGLRKGAEYSILAKLAGTAPDASASVKTMTTRTALKDARDIAEEYINGTNLTDFNNKTDRTELAMNHMVHVTVDENGNYLIVPQTVTEPEPVQPAEPDAGEMDSALSAQPTDTKAETVLKDAPATGDTRSMVLWLVVFLCSVGGVVITAGRLFQKKHID